MSESRFWKTIPLDQLSEEQWESLCDGCARCCLIKLENVDSGEICTTNLACRYLDLEHGGCTQYRERTTLVPECVKLTPDNLAEQFHYMPQSCAYRLVYETGDLPDWHPLVNGGREAMDEAGIGITHFAVSETVIEGEDQWFDHIIDCDD
jgi:uncharacterized cysteine cluster protein YcgN (CxxCxxCC family)